jgi:hypothetical protein
MVKITYNNPTLVPITLHAIAITIPSVANPGFRTPPDIVTATITDNQRRSVNNLPTRITYPFLRRK